MPRRMATWAHACAQAGHGWRMRAAERNHRVWCLASCHGRLSSVCGAPWGGVWRLAAGSAAAPRPATASQSSSSTCGWGGGHGASATTAPTAGNRPTLVMRVLAAAPGGPRPVAGAPLSAQSPAPLTLCPAVGLRRLQINRLRCTPGDECCTSLARAAGQVMFQTSELQRFELNGRAACVGQHADLPAGFTAAQASALPYHVSVDGWPGVTAQTTNARGGPPQG
jgi:hypothetical protein